MKNYINVRTSVIRFYPTATQCRCYRGETHRERTQETKSMSTELRDDIKHLLGHWLFECLAVKLLSTNECLTTWSLQRQFKGQVRPSGSGMNAFINSIHRCELQVISQFSGQTKPKPFPLKNSPLESLWRAPPAYKYIGKDPAHRCQLTKTKKKTF